jgi:hypothetical protein
MMEPPTNGVRGKPISTVQEVRFVVITKNSARWFGIILDRYLALGVSPFVLLDESSNDGTEQLLIKRNIEYVKVLSELPRVESLVKLIPKYVSSEWVIRLDDDEAPSRAMCEWIKGPIGDFDRDVIGFQRRWIRLNADGKCEYSRHSLIVSRFGVLDAQLRLFRPSAVRYRSDIHTPGFYITKGSPIAPGRAYIAHCNWLVRSASERRLQIEDYDRQEPDAGLRFRDIKVWEDCDIADHKFKAMETDEFDGLAAELEATILRNSDSEAS